MTRIIFLLLFLLVAVPVLAQEDTTVFDTGQVQIFDRTGRHKASFSVEVARTATQQHRGLMFRHSLPEDQGMIFLYDRPQVLAMWMKNTFITLDMLFVRQDGTIARLHERATPLSPDIISSHEDVIAVLEIGGGRAQELGIAPGDLVYFTGK